MNNVYKKLQYNYIENIDKINNNKFLNTYLFLLVSSNEMGKVTTSPEIISEYLEQTVDKRTTKTEEYKEILQLMNIDFKNKNNIILPKIINYTTYLKQWHSEEKNNDINNKDILEIYLLDLNIQSNYIPVYTKEYEYLLNVCKLASNKQKRKINTNTLIILYFYLKYLYFKNNQIPEISISYVNLSKKTKVTQKTIVKYIRILQEYNLVSVKIGNNSEENQNFINQYELLNKNWLITNQNSKIIELKEYLNNI